MTAPRKPIPPTVVRDFDRATKRYWAAEEALAAARETMREAAAALAAEGASENAIALRAGVTRQTVRAWLGK